MWSLSVDSWELCAVCDYGLVNGLCTWKSDIYLRVLICCDYFSFNYFNLCGTRDAILFFISALYCRVEVYLSCWHTKETSIWYDGINNILAFRRPVQQSSCFYKVALKCPGQTCP